jgi:CoA:oxalate CoA-transferase
VPGPLAGVRILDYTEVIAGPYGASLLGDMGAEVIKIEPIDGEPLRSQSPFRAHESRGFVAYNRGKRSLAVNLRDPRGQQIVHDLAREADVFITNYRPDTPGRLGVDYETLSALNPRLIYVRSTAFGPSGPLANNSGYDIITQAYTGIMTSIGGERDGLPTTIPTAIADLSTALVNAWSVCGALYARERTGEGQLIDTSLLATAMTVQPGRYLTIKDIDDERHQQIRSAIEQAHEMSSSYSDGKELVSQARLFGTQGRSPIPTSSRVPSIYYRTYQAADGFVAVGCLSPALRKKFCQALEIHDPRYGEPLIDPVSDEFREIGLHLTGIVETSFQSRTVAQWLSYLDRSGVPSGPVLFAEELRDNDQVKANDLIVKVRHETLGEVEMVGPVVQMSKTPLEVRWAAPALGAHTDAILGALGYQPDVITGLRSEGVIR